MIKMGVDYLDIPDEEVKYGDSDTVAVLSAISLQSGTFDIYESVKMLHFYRY